MTGVRPEKSDGVSLLVRRISKNYPQQQKKENAPKNRHSGGRANLYELVYVYNSVRFVGCGYHI